MNKNTFAAILIVAALLSLVFVDASKEHVSSVKKNHKKWSSLSSMPLYRSNHHAKKAFSDIKRDLRPSTHTVPVYNIPGLFFTDILVGNPPAFFRVQIDTGSATLAIPHTSCKSNGGYDPRVSLSSSIVDCDGNCRECTADGKGCAFSIAYGDGSGVNGSMYTDVVGLGGLSAITSFGVIFQESSGFEPPNVDGIMGFAYESINCNPTCTSTVFASLASHNNMPDVFSLCFSDTGGALTLGGADSEYYAGDIRFTPAIGVNFYVIELQDIKVNGQSIDVPRSLYNDSIIDTGTTLLILPQTAFDALVTMLEVACTTNAAITPLVCSSLVVGDPFNATAEEIRLLPTVQFSIGGPEPFTVSLPPWAYIRDDLTEPSYGRYVLGVSPQPDGFGVLLGDTFLQMLYVVFDREDKAIGFANAKNCNPTCSQFADRTSCVSSFACGWCEDLGTCVLGDHEGPIVGTCEWTTTVS